MKSLCRIARADFLCVLFSAVFLGGCGESQTPPPVPQEMAKPTPEQEFSDLLNKAEAGDAVAQTNLGVAYSNGQGVPKDQAKAAEWYQRAAALGNVDAQFNLGRMYEEEQSLPFDLTKAKEWYQKAAVQGHAGAQYHLGKMYTFSFAHLVDANFKVTIDTAKAVEWYQKAAVQGHADAQYSLGVAHSSGQGVPKDQAKAAEWYQKAAVQGHADAQYILSESYYEGKGVPKDIVLAYAWANLAAAAGSIAAPNLRSEIESRLSAKELAEAQRLSSGWTKGRLPAHGEGGGALAAGVPAVPGAISKKGTGTLFVVSITGNAITNQHVVQGCTELRIEGRDGVAKLITEDQVNDLALVQISAVVKDTATISAEPGKLRQGDDIVVFGFPLNTVLSSGGNLTPGVVSALTGLGNNTNQIQITAPIQPGSSGSPVINKKGEVVGVVAMKLSDAKMAKATGQIGQNINFAVSGQTLKTFLDAHKVEYRSGGMFSFGNKSTADLADEARKWTLVVECWK